LSDVGKFSQDISVIMATIVEFVPRRLTKRPTVARISESAVRLVINSPTRASEPRTEITRPKEVTADQPVLENARPPALR
jgi:hypothetical protein